MSSKCIIYFLLTFTMSLCHAFTEFCLIKIEVLFQNLTNSRTYLRIDTFLTYLYLFLLVFACKIYLFKVKYY